MTAEREAEIVKQIEEIQDRAVKLEAENDPVNEPYLEFLEEWYWELKGELENG